jgi:5-methyltetrahydrofolate--homocysteine methyltransferase
MQQWQSTLHKLEYFVNKTKEQNMEPLIQEIYTAVMDGKNVIVQEKVQASLAAGIPATTILNDGMIAAMTEVGRLFEEGEYFVPEMLISARAMQAGLVLLKPALKEVDFKSRGKVVIGTVKGDLHDIGKNLVCMMLEGASFEVIDLGTDVTPEKFVEAVRVHHPQLVGMSALLTTTMPNIPLTIEALKAAGLRDQVKVMVGGAPVTGQYAHEIGADGTASDASQAVTLARNLLGIA